MKTVTEALLEISKRHTGIISSYECDYAFVKTFILSPEDLTDPSPDILDTMADFAEICRIFVQERHDILKQYSSPDYIIPDKPGILKFLQEVLGLMLNAALGGDDFATSLLLAYYSVFYRSEYKVLKHFKSLSPADIVSVGDLDKDYTHYSRVIARIMVMSRLMKIELTEESKTLYGLFYAIKKTNSYTFSDILQQDIDTEQLNDSAETIIALSENQEEYKSAEHFYKEATDFVNLICESKEVDLKFESDLSKVILPIKLERILAAKRAMHGDGYVSLKDIISFEYISMLAMSTGDAITSDHDFFRYILGLTDELKKGGDNNPFLKLKLSGIKSEETEKDKEERAPEKKPAREKKKETLREQQEKAFHARLRELKAARQAEHEDLAILRAKMAEMERENAELRKAQKELKALRDYAYAQAEEDMAPSSVSLPSMKSYLGQKRVIIIGGYPNWVAKMHQTFKDWTFLDPDPSGTVDTRMINSADYVFFFTGCLKHARYYQFIDALREGDVPFGYLSSVNIEGNIRDIYKIMSQAD